MRAKQFIESALGTNPKRPARAGSRPERGHEPQKRYVTDRKTGKQYDPDEQFEKTMNSPEVMAQMKRMAAKEGVAAGSLEEYGDTAKGQKMLTKVQKRAVDRVVSKKADTDPAYAKKNQDTANRAWDRMTDKDVAEGNGISKDKETKFHAKLDALVHDTFGKREDEIEEIAGAFPSPSTREKWAKDAAASNAAEAKRQAELKAKADAQRLQQNTELVDKEQKVNHHSLSPDTTPPVPMKESKTQKVDASKPRNFVAKNAINTGAGAHKDKKKAEKQGDFKHKKQAIPIDEAMQELEAAFKEEKAPRALCISSKPDEDLGASQLASCKSQGLRARDGNKSHKLGKSAKSRVKVGGKRIKGNKYGGPLPDWS